MLDRIQLILSLQVVGFCIFGGFAYGIYRLAGGEIYVYYSVAQLFDHFNIDVVLRLLILFITFLYMLVPACLVLRYSKEFTAYLRENVSDPESYDFVWLRKIMIILSVMYLFYLALLWTDSPVIYVIDKATILIIWYYFFYKALFLKAVPLENTFKSGWNLPYQRTNEEEDNDEHGRALSRHYAEAVAAWFEKEKPYLRDDLRLTDLQRVFPMSRSYLSQLFNKELGCSFSDYVNNFRIEESKRLLNTERSASIQEIAERSGFYSISTFRRAFIKHTGLTPSEYRKG